MSDPDIELFPLPTWLAQKLRDFLVDKKRGNVSFHIKDGVILNAHVEELVGPHKPPPSYRRTA